MNPFCFLAAAFVCLLLASCSTSTIPTAADMDRFYQKAERMADSKIVLLSDRKQRGEITEAEYEAQALAIRGRVPNQAMELAWARHEVIDAQRRALGIPTGDKPVEIQVPGAGGGESFYKRAGQTGGQNFYSNAPYGGSVFGGPNRGDRPTLPPVQAPGGQPEPPPMVEPEPCP